MQLTETRTLRSGPVPWDAESAPAVASDALPRETVDIVVIGAGVMGAMLADTLSAGGAEVALVDRRAPAQGSTAASTALVMWGADVPLTHLAQTVGEAEAARRWRRVHRAVRALAERIDASDIACGRIDRPELYLSGSLLDDDALRLEGEARRRAGLPSDFLNAGAVAARFGIAARAALISQGCYEVDPVKLTLGLIAKARSRGASLCFPADAIRVEETADAIVIHLSDGNRIAARQAILATGYERATWFLPAAFAIGSSYAIATRPGCAPRWRENAMIWEASSPYLYARATADGRIVAGGEDEDFDDAQQRDALTQSKSGTIQAKLAAMIDDDAVAIDCAWAAAFGSSPDGLPAIGRVEGYERLSLAAGFGGNGVTFAALGAELITAELSGTPDPDAACFDPYRF